MSESVERAMWISRVLGVGLDEDLPSGGSPLEIWRSAKDRTGEQIGQLQDALRATRMPLFMDIADKGLTGFSGRVQVGMQAAVFEFDQAKGEARDAAAKKLKAAVSDMRSFLQSHPAVTMLERNPLGVTITLRATLGAALDAIDKVVAT